MFNFNTKIQINTMSSSLQDIKNKYFNETGPISLTDFERMAIGFYKTQGKFFNHFRLTEIDSYSIMLNLISQESPEGFLVEFSKEIGSEYVVWATYNKEGFVRKTEKYINGQITYVNSDLIADNKVIDSMVHDKYIKNKSNNF